MPDPSRRNPQGDELPLEVRQALADPKKLVTKYVMVARVGKGGMGEVWRGWDRELNRWVALKFLLKGSDDDRKRFLREAQITARLSHPNIVGIHDVGEHDGRPFIAMQFIEGKSLDEERIPVRRAMEIIRDAATAVEVAHRQGLVHRDLKPANLMVDKSGKTYVTDFGLVKPARGESMISHAGTIMGTPVYMSPEQADARKLDARSDIYSLGATLYTLVTGKLPFHGDTPAQTVLKVITKDPIAPRKHRPDLSPDVENIILKAMEKEPARRYRTAAELAADIQRFLDGEPVHAHPPSIGYQLRKLVAKRKGLVAAGAVGLIVLPVLVGVLVAGLGEGRAFDEAKTAAKRAFADGAWARAEAEAERALKMRADRDLADLLEETRGRLADEKRKAQDEKQKSDELARSQRLRDGLKPYEAEIKEARSFFYIKAANIREKIEKIERAIPRLKAIADSDDAKGAADAWILIGMAAYFAGDFVTAEAALLEAEKVAPSDFTTCFYLARICLERSVRARFTSDRTPQGGRAEGERQSARAVKYMQKAGKAAEEIDQHLAEVYRAYGQDKRPDVLSSCEAGLGRFSGIGTEEYWLMKGLCTRPADAVRCFTKALDIRPHYAWAYFLRGQAKLDAGDVRGAVDDYTEALRIHPKDLACLNNRATVRSEGLGDHNGAIEDHTEALRIDPKNADAYYNRGNVWKRLQNLDNAIEDYTQALKVSPKMAEAMTNRGNCRIRKDDFDGGLADLDAAIEMDPTYPEAWASRATAKQVRRDYDGAIRDLKKALEVAPSNWIYRPQATQQLEALIRARDGG